MLCLRRWNVTRVRLAGLAAMVIGAFASLAIGGDEGTNSTSYGLAAGTATGSYNSFFGNWAGGADTDGYANTFLGYAAGRYTVHGDLNVAVGWGAQANGDTSLGTYVGAGAGHSLSGTASTYNAFVGYEAGHLTTTGTWNTFVGGRAGSHNTTAGLNTYLGYLSGYSGTNGGQNTFVGARSGYSIATGHENTLVGIDTGYGLTTGYYNTFVGSLAGYSTTEGNRNNYFGYHAGYSNTTGSYNTLFGDYAGNNNTTGTRNTILGDSAGFLSHGSRNVFIGYGAGYSESGSQRLYIETSSSAAPLIYGEFDNDIVAVNGWLGIGTQSPSYPLEMASGAHVTTGGVWTDASSREYKQDISPLSLDAALGTLEALQPVTYEYKAAPEEQYVGFIAEDVPDLVAMKDRKSLSPMDIVAVLAKVVQHQQQTIAEQRELIRAQQLKMAALSERMATLERAVVRAQ
jgi:hypothetical protein